MPRPNRRSQAQALGFSPIDLLATIVILCITMVISMTAYRLITQTASLASGAQRVAGNFRLCRQMASSQGVPYIVAWNPDAGEIRVVRDENQDGDPDPGEAYQGPFIIPRGLKLTNPNGEGFAANHVSFLINGTASASGSLYLTDARGDTSRVAVISPIGDVQVN